MASQGTMELWDGMDKRDQACVPDLGLVGCPMGSQGTMGQWDVAKSKWTFYGKAGELCFSSAGSQCHSLETGTNMIFNYVLVLV